MRGSWIGKGFSKLGLALFMACLVASLGLVACDGGPFGASPLDESPPEGALFQMDQEDLSPFAIQLQAGYQCGWASAWNEALYEAKVTKPEAFQEHTKRTGQSGGYIAFALGFLGLFILAWSLPLYKRRMNKPRPVKMHANTWLSFFWGLWLRFWTTMGRWFRLSQLDPLIASRRQHCVELTMEMERQLRVVLEQEDAFKSSSRGEGFLPEIKAWLQELHELRQELEGPGKLPQSLLPDRLMPELQTALLAAKDLRQDFERFAALLKLERFHDSEAIEGHWDALQERLKRRPRITVNYRKMKQRELAAWVRPLGFLSLLGLLASLPMISWWMAAGAYPIALALPLGMVSFLGLLISRVQLFRAARLPLLPGMADQLVNAITWLGLFAILAMLGSFVADDESGFNLGVPPPVTVLDDALLKAPPLKGFPLDDKGDPLLPMAQ